MGQTWYIVSISSKKIWFGGLVVSFKSQNQDNLFAILEFIDLSEHFKQNQFCGKIEMSLKAR